MSNLITSAVKAAPGTPAVATGAAGSPNGVYQCVVTFVDTRGETTGSVAAPVTCVNQQIAWSSIATGPAGTTARKLYRPVAGGLASTAKLVTTLANNTTTTFTDNVADGSLGATVPSVNTTGVEVPSPIRGQQWVTLWKWPQRVRRAIRPQPMFPQSVATRLVVQHTTIPGSGVLPTYVAAAQYGDSFTNAAAATLLVINSGPSSVTVTVVAQNQCEQHFLHPLVLIVPVSATPAEIGPFDFHYQNLVTGLIQVTYSSPVGLLVAVTAP